MARMHRIYPSLPRLAVVPLLAALVVALFVLPFSGAEPTPSLAQDYPDAPDVAGPDGPDGPDGPAGPDGVTAPDGVPGPDGVDGPNGPDGIISDADLEVIDNALNIDFEALESQIGEAEASVIALDVASEVAIVEGGYVALGIEQTTELANALGLEGLEALADQGGLDAMVSVIDPEAATNLEEILDVYLDVDYLGENVIDYDQIEAAPDISFDDASDEDDAAPAVSEDSNALDLLSASLF